jgi:hypothetical protein
MTIKVWHILVLVGIVLVAWWAAKKYGGVGG